MAWEYETSGEFEVWFKGLNRAEKIEVIGLPESVAMLGPRLGRPHADTLKGSRHANMKELRGKTDRSVLRIAFAFDPRRVARILCGGDKAGVSEKTFYKKLIAKADNLFQEHLNQLEKGR